MNSPRSPTGAQSSRLSPGVARTGSLGSRESSGRSRETSEDSSQGVRGDRGGDELGARLWVAFGGCPSAPRHDRADGQRAAAGHRPTSDPGAARRLSIRWPAPAQPPAAARRTPPGARAWHAFILPELPDLPVDELSPISHRSSVLPNLPVSRGSPVPWVHERARGDRGGDDCARARLQRSAAGRPPCVTTARPVSAQGHGTGSTSERGAAGRLSTRGPAPALPPWRPAEPRLERAWHVLILPELPDLPVDELSPISHGAQPSRLSPGVARPCSLVHERARGDLGRPWRIHHRSGSSGRNACVCGPRP
jgi:hypothetical protein